MAASELLSMGYALAGLALALVVLYFFVMMLLMRLLEPQATAVARYEPPASMSPGVAAWLLEHGELPRAMASAIASMAAKSYVKIEQDGDIYSVTQLGPDVSLDLAPEEDALARTLFKGYDCFEFDEPSPHLREALRAFECALMDTTYFSKHIFLSVPAWMLSGAGVLFALGHGDFLAKTSHSGIDVRLLGLLVIAFTCLIAGVRSLPDVLRKMASRLPGSTWPKRPWSSSDSMTFALFVAGVAGVALLAFLSTYAAALLTAGFLAVNAIFYHALQGPTAAGRRALAQINEYKMFLTGVDADRISRMNACTTSPAEVTIEHAYAIAFGVDRGWGEQFVGTISSLVERTEVLGRVVKDPVAQGL